MIRSRLSYVRYYLRILTLLLPACAYFIAIKIHFGFNFFFPRSAPAGLPSYWGIVLLTTIVWAIAAEESGLWSAEQLYAPGRKSRKLLEAVGFTYAVIMALGFLYREASYSRVVIAISAVALFVLATIARIFFRVLLEQLRKSGKNEIRILMVGTDAFAQRVATSLLNGEVLPCKVVGFVHLPGQEIVVEGAVYEVNQIPTFSNGHSIDDVIIALPAGLLSEVQGIAPTLEKLCVPTRVVLDLGAGVGIRDRLIDLGGIHMLDLRPTLAETGPYLVQKRIFDIALSLLIVVLTLPLSVVIALAVKLTSHGPIFFVQERVGLNGRLFRMLKFRTMRVGSQEDGDTQWTCANDPGEQRSVVFCGKPTWMNSRNSSMSLKAI